MTARSNNHRGAPAPLKQGDKMQKHIMQTLDAIEGQIIEIAEALNEARAFRSQKMLEDPDFVNTDEYTDSLQVSIDLKQVSKELHDAYQTIFKYFNN